MIPKDPYCGSHRLRLTRMSEDFLARSIAATNSSDLSSETLTVPPEWLAEKWLMSLRLEQYRADAAYRDWGLWAVALHETRQMIGHIGFHTPPNAPYLQPYAQNAVEFGFTIFPAFRRQGFATEAATALMDWAMRSHRLTRFVMSISPQSTPSLRIADRLGFQRIGHWEDEKDGPEGVFLLDRAVHS